MIEPVSVPILLDVDLSEECGLEVDVSTDEYDMDVGMSVVVEESKIAENGLPPHGLPGQVLIKQSEDDYDADWEDQKNTFFANYRTTTSSEIAEAINAGRHVVAVKDGFWYPYFGYTAASGYIFSNIVDQYAYNVYCKDDIWTNDYARIALDVIVQNKVDKTIIAKNFSASKDYSVGDYVWYGDRLYRFTEDHTRGAWDSSDVVEAVLTDDIDNAPNYIPPGGSIGDLLIKSTNVDYAMEWVSPATSVEQDNTRPITAAAVYTEVGNINALLATI